MSAAEEIREREVPGTSVQVEALHDRIAVLEQRNGALDADSVQWRRATVHLRADLDALRADLGDAVRAKVTAEHEVAALRLALEATEREATTWMDRCKQEQEIREREVDRLERPTEAHATLEATELLEAQGGVFVPIPAGHMLSVTVTPYAEEGTT